MTNTIEAPDRDIQGPEEIGRLHDSGSQLGNEFVVVAEERTMGSMRGVVKQALGYGHAGHEEEED
jgi:hypothetical protein